ncbi:hypothetical protein ASPZODRAFT_127540 [Penicilliopsis zonata CBS 506.65]|uniref:Methyltransferase domain-containing protein n=1 Tax=Penicilliopsis zonata CBS 506.65 TaxID=1073090 RepID=A0A1L9SW78_9EURO|nr:hypothetical protein ASPZODRAFT_127540 [Penicilliopsis zonata CBS 506.65]OJJ51465.1 hypothetical protein ASPZODRAFT_127540 [Penicilliopsis zonata CBS 506.65]
MSASRISRVPVKKAQGAGKLGNQGKLSRASPQFVSPPTTSLPKRANPLLTNPPREVRRRLSPKGMAFLGMGVLVGSAYVGMLYASYQRDLERSRTLQIPPDVSDRYQRTAASYDAEVDMSETLMRMGTKREELVKRARGDVLEVSCGTGRNMEYYELGEKVVIDSKGRASVQGCRSVTFSDLSPEMVELARQKYEVKMKDKNKNKNKNKEKVQVSVAFKAQDAGSIAPPEGRPHFDTVVQTMGLCSMPDPVGVLQHLGSITEPREGRILLLEHGRSHYAWVNRILDDVAPAHADKHGCWWNRDIGEIVRQSGLEVVEMKRWHLGTTWQFVLRPIEKV